MPLCATRQLSVQLSEMIQRKGGNINPQPRSWRYRRYWKRPRDRIEFTDGTSTLERHEDIRIVRHVKVQGDKSPGACPSQAQGKL